MTKCESMSGGCLCGSVQYTVAAKPFAADYCHCSMCQRSTGSVVGAWMDFKYEELQWVKKDELREYASSEFARRGFCGQCGSTLSYRDTRHEQYVSLAISSLDQPEKVQPSYHIHTDSQLPWLKIDDDCVRYPRGQSD